MAEYVIPAGQSGVVWEVAEISGSQVTPSQRVYTVLEGKSWWLTKGGVSAENLEARQAYYDVLFHGGRYYWGRSLFDYDERDGLLDGWQLSDYMNYYVLRDINGDGIDELYIQDTPYENASVIGNSGFDGEVCLDVYGGFLLSYRDGNVCYYDQSDPRLCILLQDNMIVECAGDICSHGISIGYYNEAGEWIGTMDVASATFFEVYFNYNGGEYREDEFEIQGNPVSKDEYIAWLSQLADYINNNQIPVSEWTELNEQNFRTKELGGNVQTTNLSAVREAYYEYIRTSTYLNCEGAHLIFADDNQIPEIYLYGLETATGDHFLWYADGTVQERFFTRGGGEYIPKTGLILSHEGQIEYYDILCRLEDGILQEVASGEYERPESVNNFSEYYNWNGQEAATYEEYEQLLSQDYDFNQSIGIGEVTGMTMSELLNLLQDDAAFADAVRAAW